MSTSDSIPPRRGGPPPRRLWLWAVPAALAAGVVAWAVGETRPFLVEPEKVPMVTMGQHHMGTSARTVLAAVVATSARLQGAFGAALGLALGAAGGLARRSPGRAASAALLGGACGAAAGFAASYAAIPLYERSRGVISDDIILSILMHGAIAVAVGGSAALALGTGACSGPRQIGRCVLGGVTGALLGTAVFDFIGAAYFANDATGEPVSKTALTRLLSRLLVAGFVGMAASTAVADRSRLRLAEGPRAEVVP